MADFPKFPNVDSLYDLPAKARDRLTERLGIFVVDPAAGESSESASAAIQSKINRAAEFGGGLVLIPPGTYPIGVPLTVTSGITIQGVGRGSTILRLMDSINLPVLQNATLNVEYVTLRDMTLDGNLEGQDGGAGFSVIRVDTCYRWVFDQLEVLGGFRNELVNAGGGECIELIKGGRHKISNCYVHDTDYDGVKLRTSHYNIITNLHAHNCGKSGVQFAFAHDLAETGYPSEMNQIIGLTVTHETGVPGHFSPGTTGVTFHSAFDNVISGLVVDGPTFVFNAAATNARNIVTNLNGRALSIANSTDAMLELGRASVVNGFVRGPSGYVSPRVVSFDGGMLLQSGSDLIWRQGGSDVNLTP